MKRITVALFFITLVVAAARFISLVAVDPSNQFEVWTTYQKHPHHPNLVRSHTSTIKEKRLAQINSSTSMVEDNSQRAPASKNNTKSQKVIKFKGRELFNQLGHKEEKLAELPSLNTPDKKWKGKAAGKLLRFQDPSTKLFMIPQKSVVKIEEDGARYAEVVQVKFLTESGKRTSYNALIDSQSGELIRSWNQSIQDSAYSRKEKVNLTVTGQL